MPVTQDAPEAPALANSAGELEDEGTNQPASTVQDTGASRGKGGNGRGRASAAKGRSRTSPMMSVPPGAGQTQSTVRPRLMIGARPRMMGSPGIPPNMMGLRSTRPRTPIYRPVRPLLVGHRYTGPMQGPKPLVQVSQQNTALENHQEDPLSDPLAEESTQTMTYHDNAESLLSTLNKSEAFTDVNQNLGELDKLSTMPSAMKRPRMMTVGTPGHSGLKPNPRVPPGPRMWKSPTPSPGWRGPTSGMRTAATARPLFRAMSRPFQLQAAEVEVINVEEEEKMNKDEECKALIRKLPDTVTVERKNEARFTFLFGFQIVLRDISHEIQSRCHLNERRVRLLK